MMITLTRVGQSERGTFGVLSFQGVPFVLTLEEPWKDNAQFLSCIPVGRYVCQAVRSPKFGPTYEVMNVPGRTHVLFHRGNTLDDTEGCILVGEEFSGTFDKPVIVSSLRGFGEMMALCSGHPTFDLDIVDASTLTHLGETLTI